MRSLQPRSFTQHKHIHTSIGIFQWHTNHQRQPVTHYFPLVRILESCLGFKRKNIRKVKKKLKSANIVEIKHQKFQPFTILLPQTKQNKGRINLLNNRRGTSTHTKKNLSTKFKMNYYRFPSSFSTYLQHTFFFFNFISTFLSGFFACQKRK